jgi:pilus assembly protein Flp/PilA
LPYEFLAEEQTLPAETLRSFGGNLIDLDRPQVTRPLSPVRVTKEFRMTKLLVRFVKEQCGATAIEYALIAAGISIAIVVTVNGLGATLNDLFTSVNTSLK